MESMKKIVVDKAVLLGALQTAGRVAPVGGGALPVLSGVRILSSRNETSVTGTDLDITVSARFNSGTEGFHVVVPARILTNVIKSLPTGMVELEAPGEATELDALTVRAGAFESTIRLLPKSEWPHDATKVDVDGTMSDVSADALTEALARVGRAASTDDARPILTGTLFEPTNNGLRLVATDSYRLAVYDLDSVSLGVKENTLVPARALRELARVLPSTGTVKIDLDDRAMSIQTGEVTISTRLIQGDYPNYGGLLKTDLPNRLQVDTTALTEAVDRVALLASMPNTPIRLGLEENLINVSAITQGVGEAVEAVDAKYDGEPFI